MVKKKKKNEVFEAIKPPLTLGLASTSGAIIGPSFDNFLPSGMTNPITHTSITTSRFVGPVSVISAGGLTLKQMKKLEKKVKKK